MKTLELQVERDERKASVHGKELLSQGQLSDFNTGTRPTSASPATSSFHRRMADAIRIGYLLLEQKEERKNRVEVSRRGIGCGTP